MQNLHRWTRRAVAAFLGASLVVGAAWAGVGLAPAGHSTGAAGPGAANADAPAPPAGALAAAQSVAATTPEADPLAPPDLSALKANPLSGGLFYVGADESSIEPDRTRWQTQNCSTNGSGGAADVQAVVDRMSRQALPGWPKSPDCVYLGGYGIGPARPATGFDTAAPPSVRSIAVSNGTDLVVWQIVDLVGFFATYRSDLCNPGCGMLDIRRRIAADLQIDVADIAVGATHTHGGADGYGAWGGLPDWYRAQLRDTIIASAYRALRNVKVSTIRTGETAARSFNNERRDTYYSAPDFNLVWMQARAVPANGNADDQAGPVVATVVNFAGHPTDLGSSNKLIHGDWPGAADKAMAEQMGGVGLLFEGGLGNVSPDHPKNADADLTGDGQVDGYDNVVQHGRDFAAWVKADVERGGHRVADSTIKSANTTIAHPSTNQGENGLSFGGLLDREFTPGTDGADGPGAWSGGKSAGKNRPCATAGPVQIKTDLTAFRIGDLRVLTTPGEVFGTITEVLKSKINRDAMNGGQTMVFGQTQDSLGYIIQSFEVDPAGGVLENNPGENPVQFEVEYEEEFMLDRCFGDHVVQDALELAKAIG